jgi:hypothetical protein
LPSGISVGSNQYPFYVMGFSSTSSVALGESPQINIQLPSNFSSAYQILGALCTSAACPVQPQDGSVIPMLSQTGGINSYSFAAGSFPDFTTVTSTPQYIVAYINRSIPAGGVSSPVPIPYGGYGVINVPAVPASPPPGVTPISSVVQIGGLSATTNATVAAQTGLFPEQTAIVPNTQTVFYALKITTSGTVTTPGFQCGSTNCALASVAVSPDVIAAAGAKSFYVEQCSGSNCPIVVNGSPLAPTHLTLNANNQLNVSPLSFGSQVTGFSLTTPVYLVFFYQ